MHCLTFILVLIRQFFFLWSSFVYTFPSLFTPFCACCQPWSQLLERLSDKSQLTGNSASLDKDLNFGRRCPKKLKADAMTKLGSVVSLASMDFNFFKSFFCLKTFFLIQIRFCLAKYLVVCSQQVDKRNKAFTVRQRNPKDKNELYVDQKSILNVFTHKVTDNVCFVYGYQWWWESNFCLSLVACLWK